MKEIRLTQGKVALVDDADFDWLNQWKWSYAKRGYAVRTVGNKHVTMHRQIMQAQPGQIVDHKETGVPDHALNNQRENLRICNSSQNGANSKLGKNNTSGYKGVCWAKGKRKWMSKITKNRKTIFIGYFSDPIDAAKAYDLTAQKLFGLFANTNFPI